MVDRESLRKLYHNQDIGAELATITEPGTRQQAWLDAVTAEVNDLHSILLGIGAHAEHKRRQVGRCVYCSCGKRAQGRMSKDGHNA